MFKVFSLGSKNKVNVETDGSNEINYVDWGPNKYIQVWTGYKPDQEFKGEPSITDTFNIEEGIMGLAWNFVKSPICSVEGAVNSEVLNHWYPHIWMGLQAEGQNRNAYEENLHNANYLKLYQWTFPN